MVLWSERGAPMKKEFFDSEEPIRDEDIQRAYKIAAKVVAMYGDIYLPIFMRLHNELKKIEEREKIKLLALETDDM